MGGAHLFFFFFNFCVTGPSSDYCLPVPREPFKRETAYLASIWQLGHLQEHTGFLVSRSLTLPCAPPWAPRCYSAIFPEPHKNNKNCLLFRFHCFHSLIKTEWSMNFYFTQRNLEPWPRKALLKQTLYLYRGYEKTRKGVPVRSFLIV